MECNACLRIGMDGRKLESLDGAAGGEEAGNSQLSMSSSFPREMFQLIF